MKGTSTKTGKLNQRTRQTEEVNRDKVSRPIPFLLAAVSVCDIQAFTENWFAKKGADRKSRDRQRGSHIRGILLYSMQQSNSKQTKASMHFNHQETEEQHKEKTGHMHRFRNQKTQSRIMLESGDIQRTPFSSVAARSNVQLLNHFSERRET